MGLTWVSSKIAEMTLREPIGGSWSVRFASTQKQKRESSTEP